MSSQTLFSLLFVAACLLATCDAYRYSSGFKSQVTHFPNIMTEKGRCLPGKGSVVKNNILICDPQEILSIDQGKPVL